MRLFSICFNYIIIVMLTSTPWSFIYFLLLFEKIDQMSLKIMGFCFHFPKVLQLPSNLFISVANDNGGLLIIFL